jgi:hypothetical protein
MKQRETSLRLLQNKMGKRRLYLLLALRSCPEFSIAKTQNRGNMVWGADLDLHRLVWNLIGMR